MKIPCVKTPCKDCPFRIDSIKGWLGKEKMEEILDTSSFVCHKNNNLQCAGHMIINKEQNSFFALAKRLFIDLNLSGHKLIFSSRKECISHHKQQNIKNYDR